MPQRVIRALIREDQKRQAEQELEARLLAALDSNDFYAVTPELFERLRACVRQQHPTGQRP
jgi:hypothetical protein